MQTYYFQLLYLLRYKHIFISSQKMYTAVQRQNTVTKPTLEFRKLTLKFSDLIFNHLISLNWLEII